MKQQSMQEDNIKIDFKEIGMPLMDTYFSRVQNSRPGPWFRTWHYLTCQRVQVFLSHNGNYINHTI